MESGNDIFRANFLEFCEAMDYCAKERGLLHSGVGGRPGRGHTYGGVNSRHIITNPSCCGGRVMKSCRTCIIISPL
jgi:hypothetical protein